MSYVIKRDGRKVSFNPEKIKTAILKAFKEVDGEISNYALEKADNIASYIENLSLAKELSIEDIQDLVEKGLMATKRKDVAKAYVIYREQRTETRNIKENLTKKYNQLQNLISGNDEESNKENSNKDTTIIPTMRDYIAGFTCREMADTFILPKDIKEAHEKGQIHFHDTDYSPIMPMYNCSLINLEDMLQNGTVISGTLIEKPHTFSTACTVATQIITQVASSQYGGNTINIEHLAPFVNETRKKYTKKNLFTKEQIESLVKEDIERGIQTIQYQLITMSTTNGQAPFTSIFMYLGDAKDKQEEKDLASIIEEILRQRIEGVKNEQGVPITTAFPKLLYVLDENNIKEDSEYWYLTKLAAECSSKRLVPDYISAKKMKELKGDVFGCMGCRSFLSPSPEHKYWGRFNKGVVTINLPYVALESKKDLNKFWKIFDERLELCHRALLIRYERLVDVKSDVAPILWQYGAIARLKPGEKINRFLKGDYSTISLGYAGLWETVYYLTGKTLIDEEGQKLGKLIMQKMNEKCSEWDAQDYIGFSVYGSPIESTTYKFAKALKRDFGEIKGISDKNYVTNSYHITPSQKIDAFNKLFIESKFQELSTGGAISYIETPNLTGNIPALLEVIKYIYDTIMYAEINTMTSYCKECGCTDIKMGDDLKFHCPKCGNDDFNKMNIALRVCGYISTNPFNDGRAEDIHDRTFNLGED